MSSREKILNAIAINQPGLKNLPVLDIFENDAADAREKFISVLTAIGGKAIAIKDYTEIAAYINISVNLNNRIVSTIPELSAMAEIIAAGLSPHSLQDIDLAIIKAHFGVAENGAVWITEAETMHRVLPFITQHLAVVLNAGNIVSTMHQGYEKIGSDYYGFGTFIAGPSKTADIEQSLVLGAHGSRSMTVFLLE